MAARRRSLLGRPSVATEVEDELAFHLEMRTRDLMAGGLSEAEARERDVRIRERLEELLQDLRFAARQMRRAPGCSQRWAFTASSRTS